ncbi:MAG TPA: DUF1775 domain-containing protein [Steroidobacteraceae bacterium]|jgi:uncharacterized protein YcnI|nr:DUF1775 domain-containing protein [Steroidobacteraceae bacterium]
MHIRAIALFLFSCVCAVASAHVTVWPRESQTGSYEKYVVRVPTEGNVATTSVELVVPETVTVVSLGAPAGFTYELKRAGDRIASIVWTMRIAPGEFAEFAFMARNPKDAGEIVWRAIQRFADGTQTEWTGPRGDKHPASVTVVKAGEPGHAH